jgi:hypothetical protein
MIPLAEESRLEIKSIRDCESCLPIKEWSDLLTQRQRLALPPNTYHRLEIEYPCHSTAFLAVCALARISNVDSSVKITYSEAYEEPTRRAPFLPRKNDRTRREGNVLVGLYDFYQFSGPNAWSVTSSASQGQLEIYEPFWWKTFRFIVLEFQVGPGGLELWSIETRQTNYPLKTQASVEAEDDPEPATLLEVSIRTLRNCMFDGYSDCPYWEQLQ